MTAHQMPVQGIDVSRWQGTIDWSAVAGAGVRFAFLKATEGADYLDPKFRENWIGAGRAGVLRGAYHFMFWCRSAAEQAAWFRKNVPAEPSALPPVLDVEWNGNPKTCPQKVSRQQALAMIRDMAVAMEAHTGKKPIIYTSIDFFDDNNLVTYRGYPYWLRSVAGHPRQKYGSHPFTFWQYTGTGIVPGVTGDADINVFNGSDAAWRKWLRQNTR